MRKSDIDLNTEYAETAPLAYGRELSTRPKRIRFTSLKAAEWVLMFEAEAVPFGDMGKCWLTVDSTRQIVKLEVAEARGAKRRSGSANDVEIGTRILLHGDTERGALPAERYDFNKGTWVPYLALPAAIHRPWSEVQAKLDHQAQQAAKRRRVARVAEVSELLAKLGLDELFAVHVHNSKESIAVDNRIDSGDAFLAKLELWASEKGLI